MSILYSRRKCGVLLVILFLIMTTTWRFREGRGDHSDIVASTDPKGRVINSPLVYTKTLVIGRRERDNISWVESLSPSIARKIYIVDGPAGNSSLPANKGREGMVYLTYIIDSYPNFPDIILFFHASDIAWHNNILLDNKISEAIVHLNEALVMRNGYFNTRCDTYPGCPQWLHFDIPMDPFPNLTEWRYSHKGSLSKLLGEKPEERYLTSDLWHELHPGAPVPRVLSQAAGAQFAVSGKSIVSRPKSDYIRWRDWLLTTEMDDRFSGRIMEYMWQYIFTGRPEVCPSEHECLCDGYGICFEDPETLSSWYALREKKKAVDEEIYYLQYNDSNYVHAVSSTLHRKSESLQTELQSLKEQAFRRGKDPRARALVTRQSWMQAEAS